MMGRRKKDRKFNAFYFLKNCKLENEIMIGKGMKLIPFEGYSIRSFFDIFEKFSDEWGEEFGYELNRKTKKVIEQGIKKYEKDVPMAVLFFPILSPNEKELKKTLDRFVENVIFLLSAFLNTHVERVGFFAIDAGQTDKLDKGIKVNKRINYHFDLGKIYHDFNERRLLDEDQLSQVLNISRDIHSTIEQFGLVKHSKQLYYEYVAETNDEWGFLRLWNILEIQAEYRVTNRASKLFNKTELKVIRKAVKEAVKEIEINDDLKDAKIKNIPASLNYLSIKDKIRKLLDAYKIEIKPIDDSHDVIDQIYRFRNCVIHHGGCKKLKKLSGHCEEWCYNSEFDSTELRKEIRNIVLRVIFADFGIHLGQEEKET